MSSFSPNQLKLLTGKLDRSNVRERQAEGRSLSYIEGWFAIAEANRIFGYGGWDRQMVHFERTFVSGRGEITECGFMARVRINVRTGGTTVMREGTGFGSANARSPGEAYDKAIKAAETDATKRALATFGNRFGLCLYDKEQRGVEDTICHPVTPVQSNAPNFFRLFSPNGTVLARSLSGEGFCSGLRQLIEACKKPEHLSVLKALNEDELGRLRKIRPDLCGQTGVHYADLLARLMERRQEKILLDSNSAERPVLSNSLGKAEIASEKPLSINVGFRKQSIFARQPKTAAEKKANKDISTAPSPAKNQNQPDSDTPAAEPFPEGLPASRITGGPRINKCALSIASPRRMRDPDHLRFVRKLSCLICERTPSHAHHVKFAQRPGLSMKVSDEFVVPLCSVHHDELHRSVTERGWWEGQGIDPMPIADKLWRERGQRATP